MTIIINNGGSGSGSSYTPPTITSETTISVTTTATAADSTFAVFSSQACTELELENDTGVALEYQRNGAGEIVVIRAGQARRIVGITNANQIGVRRVDWATTVISRPTVVTARAITNTESFVVAGIISVPITNGGANTQAGSLACTGAEIINTTGKTILWRIGTSAAYRKLRDGESVIVRGITNANQLYFKAYDFVAVLLRPVTIEAFTSGITAPLNPFRQVRQVAPDARIILDDFNYPDQIGRDNLWIATTEQGDQKRTLTPKNITPLALFSTIANTTTNQSGMCVDANTGEFLFGTSAIEYTQSGTFTIATFAPGAALSAGVDVTSSDIHFEYSFPDNAGVNFSGSNLNAFAIELYSSGSPGSPPAAYHSASIGGSAQGFMKVDARRGGTIVSYSVPIENFSAVGGGATLSGITWARFYIQGSSTTGMKFRPYSIKAIKKARTKGAVVFMFDDLHIGQYTNALPILAKYNYPACLSIDTVVKMGQTNFMTPQQLINVHQKHGWQMIGQVQGGNGSSTTVDTGIAPEHGIAQMARFKAAMKALGISWTEDFSHGSTSMTSATGITGVQFDTWPALKRLFRTATAFNGGNNANPPMTHGETVPFGDPYFIRRLSMSGFTAGTLATRWQNHVDQAIATKGVAIFGAHSEFNVAGEALTAFGTLIEYIRTQELAGNCEVLTVDQLCRSAYA